MKEERKMGKMGSFMRSLLCILLALMMPLSGIAEVAAEDGYIAKEDVARLLKFRNNPDDESWMEAK